MRKLLLLLITGLMFAFPLQAGAAYIVDTGSGVPQFGVSIYNRSNGDFQINAGQFTLSQAYNVTSLETWMYSTTAGSVDLVLYGDNANLPDPSNEILRQSFNVAAPGPITAWQGLTGLNLSLGTGSYWISLEKPDVVDGFQVNLPSQAPNPLLHYAYRADESPSFGAWTAYTGAQGFRVGASDAGAVVPEPVTVASMAIGLLGFFSARKKTR